MNHTALIIFAKAPVPGFAKTRLAPVLGEAGAAALAEKMLEHLLHETARAGFSSIELCCAPDPSHPAFTRQGSCRLTAQGEGDLGQRMRRALERALRSHSHALLVGTDAPALDAAMLQRAAAALDRADAVFVPAFDGGYVLVGLKRDQPALFDGIAWSTPQVMEQTRERARTAGLSVAELEPVYDIDEPADLVHLPPGWR